MTNEITSALSQQWLLKWTPTNYQSFTPIESAKVDDAYIDDTLLRWYNLNLENDLNWKSRNYGKGAEYNTALETTDTNKRRQKQNYRNPLKLIPTALWLTTLHPGVVKQKTPQLAPFNLLYKWREIDFEFKSEAHKRKMINERYFIPENVLPLGIEVYRDRVFMTLPSWKSGRPVTLATVPRYGNKVSPLLKPYPNWNYHTGGNSDCSRRLISVFRITADNCNRLWVLDSGVSTAIENATFTCPPSIFVFDLDTDELLVKYQIPEQFILESSLYANIVLDSSFSDCSDLHAYIADPWGFGLLVFRERDQKFWKFAHHFFYPDPEAASFNLHGVKFQWTDGIFGIALGPPDYKDERILYLHPFSSYREIGVSTSILKDPFKISTSAEDFVLLGEKRDLKGQSSASVIDRNGVMFFGLIHQDSVGCWDTNKRHLRKNIDVVSKDEEVLIFTNDVKVDRDINQNVWIITNRLPIFQANLLHPSDYNFRIFFANAKEAVQGTVCDSSVLDNEITV